MWVKVKNLIGAIFSLSSLKLQLWAFMVAKMIKDLPAVWETWVQSLGWKDPLVKGKATHCSYFGLENPMCCIVHGVTKSQVRLNDFHSPFTLIPDQGTKIPHAMWHSQKIK